MSDNATTDHIDERFDAVEQRLESLSQKSDANAQAIDMLDKKIGANAAVTEAQFRVLESRQSRHSDDQIIEIIDARLQAVLPGMLREAVTDGLVAPLSLVEEAIRSSRASHDAIETLQADVTAVKASTTPLVEMANGIRFIRSFLLSAGSLAGAIGLILALVNGWFS